MRQNLIFCRKARISLTHKIIVTFCNKISRFACFTTKLRLFSIVKFKTAGDRHEQCLLKYLRAGFIRSKVWIILLMLTFRTQTKVTGILLTSFCLFYHLRIIRWCGGKRRKITTGTGCRWQFKVSNNSRCGAAFLTISEIYNRTERDTVRSFFLSIRFVYFSFHLINIRVRHLCTNSQDEKVFFTRGVRRANAPRRD